MGRNFHPVFSWVLRTHWRTQQTHSLSSWHSQTKVFDAKDHEDASITIVVGVVEMTSVFIFPARKILNSFEVFK